MRGDFSRVTYAGDHHYRRVLMQQGRVEIDADSNEQIAIDAHLSEVTNTDVIGAAGYPAGTAPDGTPLGGFALSFTANNKDIAISPGRMYVDGILVENPTPGATLLGQPELPGASLGALGAGAAGIYMAYLEVFERLITALDDPAIRETALGGPDTSVRTRVVWQVKLAYVGPTPQDPAALPGCGDVNLSGLPAPGTGTLTASTGAAADPMPCMLPPDSGYQQLENQLYRVEVHNPGADGTATFVWSRENGSVVALIVTPDASAPTPQASGPTFTVAGVRDDPTLGLKAGDWVELTDDAVELSVQPGALYQVAITPSDGKTVTINGAPTVTIALHPKLRRWDQNGTATAAGVPITTGAPVPLEGGLQVQFTAGTYNTGDYWLIPARTATSLEQGHLEWPLDTMGAPLAQPPAGVARHYAKLGLVELDSDQTTFAGLGTATEPTDCRLPFWPLTELSPDQHTGPCTLVAQPGPGWEVPILAWFSAAAAHQIPLDAEICFPVGDFPTANPVRIANAGHVRVNGAGWGTRLRATGPIETVLEFDSCASVAVCDLYAESTTVSAPSTPRATPRRTAATLSFYNCASVAVEQAWVRCGGSTSRRAVACIAIASDIGENASVVSGTASVRGCRLHPGEMQVGLQLAQLADVTVADNRIQTDPTARAAPLAQRLKDPGYLAVARNYLLSDLVDPATIKAPAAPVQPSAPSEGLRAPQPPAAPPPGSPSPSRAPAGEASRPGAPSSPPAPGPTEFPTAKFSLGAAGAGVGADVRAAAPAALTKTPIELNVGNQTFAAMTEHLLVSTWQTYLQANAPKTFATQTDARNYLRKAANTLLTSAEARTGYSAFASVLRSLYDHVPLAARAISYGGRGLGRLVIVNNTISSVLMGISVGVSHKATPAEAKAEQRAPDEMGFVRIIGNSVACAANEVAPAQARFGIFVGNAESIDISDNVVEVAAVGVSRRPPPADGIRVVGYLGPRLIVQRNVTVLFAVGIRVMPLTSDGSGPGTPVLPFPGQALGQGLRTGNLWLVGDNVIAAASSTGTYGPFEPTHGGWQLRPYIDAVDCQVVDNFVVA